MAKSIDDIGMAFVESEGYVGQATLPDASVTPIVGGPQQVPAMQRTERLEDNRSIIVYKDENNNGEKSLLGSVLIDEDFTVQDIRDEIRDCLGQHDDFVLKKCAIPLHSPQQDHYRAVDLFRKREEFLIVVPLKVWQPVDLARIFDESEGPLDTLVIDVDPYLPQPELPSLVDLQQDTAGKPMLGTPPVELGSPPHEAVSVAPASASAAQSVMGENLLEPSTIPRCLPAAPAPTPAVDARLERYQRRHGGASGAQPLPTDARRLPFSFALSPDLSGGPTTTEVSAQIAPAAAE